MPLHLRSGAPSQHRAAPRRAAAVGAGGGLQSPAIINPSCWRSSSMEACINHLVSRFVRPPVFLDYIYTYALQLITHCRSHRRVHACQASYVHIQTGTAILTNCHLDIVSSLYFVNKVPPAVLKEVSRPRKTTTSSGDGGKQRAHRTNRGKGQLRGIFS